MYKSNRTMLRKSLLSKIKYQSRAQRVACGQYLINKANHVEKKKRMMKGQILDYVKQQIQLIDQN